MKCVNTMEQIQHKQLLSETQQQIHLNTLKYIVLPLWEVLWEFNV